MSILPKAVWFIENHYARRPSLDEVAEASGTTRFHLSRTFSLATGQSLMAHMRGRRLTEALKLLTNGAPSILQVALEAGYESHEAFTRAFREQFGVTPEQARDGHVIPQHLKVEPIHMNTVADIKLAEPRYEERPAFTVAGLGERFTMNRTQDIPQLWQKFNAKYDGTAPHAVPDFWYGINAEWGEAGQDFLYMAGVEVTDTHDLPDEFRTFTFPAQRYVVFRHADHISTLQKTYGAVWGSWFPENNVDTKNMNGFFELYGVEFDPMTGEGGIELWFPVRKG